MSGTELRTRPRTLLLYVKVSGALLVGLWLYVLTSHGEYSKCDGDVACRVNGVDVELFSPYRGGEFFRYSGRTHPSSRKVLSADELDCDPRKIAQSDLEHLTNGARHVEWDSSSNRTKVVVFDDFYGDFTSTYAVSSGIVTDLRCHRLHILYWVTIAGASCLLMFATLLFALMARRRSGLDKKIGRL